MKRILLCLLLPATLCSFCKQPVVPPEPTPEEPYINPAVTSVDFDRLAEIRTFDVETNVGDITCKASASAWCEAVWNAGTVTVEVTTNEASSDRTTVILIEGKGLRRSVTVNQTGRSASLAEIKDDVRIPVASSTVTPAAQSGEGIEKSHDGSLTTIYHSRWSASVTPDAPVTLTYGFAPNAGAMDYLIYYPRTEGTNGNFREFDLYVATAEKPEPTLYGSYDFEGRGSASIISFSPALQNPTLIRFVVRSGNGDSSGNFYASCAEMQFFTKSEGNFDPSAIFTDATCSELKPGVGRSDIDNIQNKFFRELATELLNGEYDTEFRVQSYRAWEHPDVMAAANKTSTYSLLDNPTGIYVRRNEELVVLADEMDGKNVALFVQDPAKPLSGSTYALTGGVNKFKASNDGLIYVLYHTRKLTGNEPEVKINIATGHVNGYFDNTKHSKERWVELLTGATFEYFDLVGEYAHLTFQTSAFRQYTPDGKALIEKYDDLVRREQDFMGLFKYDRAFNNRMYFVVIHSGWMVASSYYTGYVTGSQSTVLNLSAFVKDSWGPAHEAGHINQTRPGFNWKGMAEVSNNVHSLFIQTEWGNRSRLLEPEGQYESRYAKGFREILDAGICYNLHNDVFCKLIPFWQLKLYMHDVLGRTDFYKDLYEAIRLNPDPATQGQCQMEFVKAACDAAKFDLTDFFEAWGFFMPVSVEIEDYGKAMFTVTREMADETKKQIAEKGYQKPVHGFERITDDNLADFK